MVRGVGVRGQGVGVRGSEEGSYLRLIDFVYHSSLCVRVIKKKKKVRGWVLGGGGTEACMMRGVVGKFGEA